MSSRAAYFARYQVEHKDEKKSYAAKYYATHKEQFRRYDKASGHKLKLDALNAYGGPKCACCGETLFEGLSIDHMNGDGAKHRRDEGTKTYRWLKQHNYPPGFQVLCFTCNYAKGTSDHCPHKDIGV